jgi:hypothetical protein
LNAFLPKGAAMLHEHIIRATLEACPFTERRRTCCMPHLGACPVMPAWIEDHRAPEFPHQIMVWGTASEG